MNSKANQMIETLTNADFNADVSGWTIFVTREFGDNREITKAEIVSLFNGDVTEAAITVKEDGAYIRF